MRQTYRYMFVDVFTETPLSGNPLAVFTNAMGMSDELMQRIAHEIGFSETAFVLPPTSGGTIRMRIFTPTQEVLFAGHPALGTAFAVAGPLQSVLVRIETLAGIVPVILEREGAKIVFGRMQQPLPSMQPYLATEELLAALRLDRSELPVEVYDNGIQHVYVALPSPGDVAAVHPDFDELRAALGNRAVSVFAAKGVYAKTRVFSPGIGVNEDPATGSAAGPLAVHLARHGRTSWGDELTISQGDEIGRPSMLYARADGTADAITSIEVGGSAVVVAKGEFLI